MAEHTEVSGTDKWEVQIFERIDGWMLVINRDKESIGALTLPKIEEAEEWVKIIKEMNKNPILI